MAGRSVSVIALCLSLGIILTVASGQTQNLTLAEVLIVPLNLSELILESSPPTGHETGPCFQDITIVTPDGTHAVHRGAKVRDCSCREAVVELTAKNSAWKPECDENGDYKPVQTNSEGKSYCMDSKGNVVSEAESATKTAEDCAQLARSTRSANLRCFARETSSTIMDPANNKPAKVYKNVGHCTCAEALAEVQDLPPGTWFPSCEGSNFAKEQISPNGHSWCVDSSGNQITAGVQKWIHPFTC